MNVRLLSLLCLSAPGAAQWNRPGTPIVAPPLPVVGSEDTVVTVAPLVPRPTSRACIVNLFDRREFAGDAPHPITVSPPPGCPGPWARVVLESDFDVTVGAQYDRTARLTLGGVNLFTGTTMEPRPTLAPRWHVERDVTDYMAVFMQAVKGTASLVNFTDGDHAGRISWRARLVFYAADATNAAPRVADIVTPVADGVVELRAKTPAIQRWVTWPRNVERMAIDVLAMPQGSDEMWQTCIPASMLPERYRSDDACGEPFRESEVRIDGMLAGLAPVYPWIFTGAMGVWNWTVIPGVGTLDLTPHRIDLTPFAALMNDGKPHRVQVSVRGAADYMATTATLLAWRDAGRSVVGGRLTRNTLVPARMRLSGTLMASRARGTPMRITAERRGSVAGYIEGSKGRVTTQIDQVMRFANDQVQRPDGEDASQITMLDTRIATTDRSGTRRERRVERYPLAWGSQGSGKMVLGAAVAGVDQGLFRDETITDADGMVRRVTQLAVSPRTLPSASVIPDTIRSTVSIQINDSRAGCYARVVTAFNARIVAVQDKQAKRTSSCTERPLR